MLETPEAGTRYKVDAAFLLMFFSRKMFVTFTPARRLQS